MDFIQGLILVYAIVFIIAVVSAKLKGRNPFSNSRYVSEAQVDNMDGHDFEYFCADLLLYDGFSNIQVTRGSWDQGVDITAWKDGQKYAIQCKRYSKNIGNAAVQQVNTGRTIYGCSKAIVITNSYFTRSAIQAAHAVNVMLWNRNKLNRLIMAKRKATTEPKPTENQGTRIVSAFSSGAGTVAVLLLFFFVFFSFSNHKSGVFFQPTSNTLPTVHIPITTETQTPKEAKPDEELQAITGLPLGCTSVLDDLKITVQNYMFARHNGNLKYLNMAEEGFIYCAVYLDVENVTDKEIPLSDDPTRYQAALMVGDNKQFSHSYVDDTEFLFGNKSISPNTIMKRKLINFKIPAEVANTDEPLRLIMQNQKRGTVVWRLQ